MSLVSYDYSDSENENSDSEDNKEPENNTGKVLLPEKNEEENTELFAKLPTPKYNPQTVIEEDDDEFLKKTASNIETNSKPKSTVKISVPSLSDFNDTDTDEVPKKVFKPSTNLGTTGLFSILPPPKVVAASNTKFVPNSVAKKPSQPPKTVKPTETISKEEDMEINDGKQSTGSFFFTSIFDTVSEPKTSPETSNHKINVDIARNVQEADLKTNRYFSDMIKNTTNVVPVEEDEPSTEETDLVKEAYTQLVGQSRKAKGKGNKKRELDIIDINATDIMPDPKDWMTKTLTEEPTVVATKKGDEPSLQQRRKHQITYLAYQAKLNEQELKNQWALNRTSRKQTQAKYGF